MWRRPLGGQHQRARTDRHRRHESGDRPGDRYRQEERNSSRVAPSGLRSVPLRVDEAGRRETQADSRAGADQGSLGGIGLQCRCLTDWNGNRSAQCIAASGRVAGAVGGIGAADDVDGRSAICRDRAGKCADGPDQTDRFVRGTDQRLGCALDRGIRGKGKGMRIDLSGKTALVTGASRGIGEAIARRLADCGAHVLCAARSAERVNEIAAEITKAGHQATGVQLDIAAGDIRGRVRALLEQRAIDILVNNAGITEDDLFLCMKPEAWTSVLRTNLDSAFHITQEVVKKMIRARWGRIINISSVVGLMGNPGQTNYAASKAGLIGFTKSLALEIGSRNVTVNAIAPGFIQTAITTTLADDQRTALEGRIALKRLGTPDDVAFAAVFLASEQAGYITGAVLNVSGGLYT